ncbi:hypothetical protein ACP25C_10585 [Cronobacter turicensis]
MNTAKLKAAAEKAKDNFIPSFMISTREVLELIAALEAAQSQTAAARDVLAERQSQILTEGWNACRDDMLNGGK